jgi:2-polyprenyl-3-methyl-5-hydroxy-6-metoxy-1,4-benzoquinol methylase
MTRYEVDIVILSNIPKDLGSDVEVIVGLPTKDPWSLPYGHKALFSERITQYDLFIYSEDDILITEQNLDVFVKITQILPDKYIAGFMRYEISGNGKKYYPDLHACYHWDPNSVLKIGEYIFAHCTNEHSACFVLTQCQLKKAIYSGGFLLPPRIGRYDMLVTAATDPYTQCGMKKLICISHLNEFSLHHLSNVYIGSMSLDAEWADREIEKLKSLCAMKTIFGPLFNPKTKLENDSWDKLYYESCRKDILSLIPKGVKRVLSVGCGWGLTESELIKKGIEVVGIPLDCVILVSAEARGIKVVPPSFEAAKEALRGESFDCVIFPDVLQHLTDPISLVRDFMNLLETNGCMIISVPNFNHPSAVRKRMLGKILFSKVTYRHDFEKYKLHFTTRRVLYAWLKRCGLEVVQSYQQVEPHHERLNRFTPGRLKGILSRNVVVLCKRASA